MNAPTIVNDSMVKKQGQFYHASDFQASAIVYGQVVYELRIETFEVRRQDVTWHIFLSSCEWLEIR